MAKAIRVTDWGENVHARKSARFRSNSFPDTAENTFDRGVPHLAVRGVGFIALLSGRRNRRPVYMILLHDKLTAMKAETTTLTERGQVSVPSSIRRALAMKPGQELVWKKISDDEVQVLRPKMAPDAAAAIGCAKKFHEARGWPTRTNAWLRRLRRGETKG